METAQEFLLQKGFRKVHQPKKRYNITIGELVEFLNEYAEKAIKNGNGFKNKTETRNPNRTGTDNDYFSRVPSQGTN
jgi:hypothetical protein